MLWKPPSKWDLGCMCLIGLSSNGVLSLTLVNGVFTICKKYPVNKKRACLLSRIISDWNSAPHVGSQAYQTVSGPWQHSKQCPLSTCYTTKIETKTVLLLFCCVSSSMQYFLPVMFFFVLNRLYLVCKQRKPQFLPEIFCQTTVVSFAVTFDAFREQLLSGLLHMVSSCFVQCFSSFQCFNFMWLDSAVV